MTPAAAGWAGNFGFEAGHYDVSMACGEWALLPAVRDAAAAGASAWAVAAALRRLRAGVTG